MFQMKIQSFYSSMLSMIFLIFLKKLGVYVQSL